jgi:hypothetical protein
VVNQKQSRTVSTDDVRDSPCANQLTGEPPEFRQYRAPRAHGEAFVQPSFADVPRVIRENKELASRQEQFASLRSRARQELIADAVRYTSAYRDVSRISTSSDAPIIMAGHQPAIFHSGVWFKNFALSHLAKQTGAVAVNLVIDNDVCADSSIRVPAVDPVSGLIASKLVPYDSGGGGVPYEQTTISDLEMFDQFDRRVRKATESVVDDACITALWKHARAAIQRCGVAGCAIAQARHGLEGEIGLDTFELPLGVVCRTTEFAEFVLSILSELPRFHRCYNDAANRYRMAHGIRSTAHPVPNLAEDGEWFEAPLWIYGDDSPQRRPAWVRMSNDHLVISDRAKRELRVDVRFPGLAAEQLAGLASPNFKLRPRALLTTMYARLILSDLFLHGIGGGKYDQLGDLIMQSFFLVTPPTFMVVSATVNLPGIETTDSTGQIQRLRRAIRDTEYQPERFVDRVTLDTELVQRKRALLAKIPATGQRQAWQNQIAQINSTLSDQLSEVKASLRGELAALQRKAASESVLASREHPFCIFPLQYLTETYQKLLASG